MSKSSFLLGVIVGGAAAAAAAMKLTDTSSEELKVAAKEKFDDFMEENDLDPEVLKQKAAESFDDLKQRGMDLANRANMKFNDESEDEEDFIIDDMTQVPYANPTEVFMPHNVEDK